MNVGVIIYLEHPTYNAYEWVHWCCVKDIKGLITEPKRSDRSLDGCSFCGKVDKAPLCCYGNILIHPDCAQELAIIVKNLIEDNGAAIVADMV